jgi:hypothetical protein
LCTSRSNVLCATTLVYLVLLDKLVMIPFPLYSHFRYSAKSLPCDPFSFIFIAEGICYNCCRRMKLQSVVCVGQSSTSNALGRLVCALVVRLPTQAERLWHLSKLVAQACHQQNLPNLHRSLHPQDFSPIFSREQGQINFGDQKIAVL